MIAPAASAPNSTFPRLAFPTAFAALLVISLFSASSACARPPDAGQQQGPGNAAQLPHATGNSQSGATSSSSASASDIATAEQRVKDLTLRLEALKAELRYLQDNKPQPPGKNATDAQKAQYMADLDAWKKKVADIQDQIRKTTQALTDAKRRLNTLTGRPNTVSS